MTRALLSAVVGLTAFFLLLCCHLNGNVSVALAQASNGVVWGRVTEETVGSPIGDAVVALVRGEGSSPVVDRVRTTDDGYFVFHAVPAGVFTLTAAKQGFRNSLDAGRPIYVTLSQGAKSGELRIELQRLGLIVGRAEDNFGDPLGAVIVRLFSQRSHGRWIAGTAVSTDDRGEFRIPIAGAGTYVVALPNSVVSRLATASTSQSVATPVRQAPLTAGASRIVSDDGAVGVRRDATQALLVFPWTFAPGSRSIADAETISLRAGESRSGVVLRAGPLKAFRISGTVRNTEGVDLSGGTLRLVSEESGATTDFLMASTLIVAGRFEFPAVPPGRYLIKFSRTFAADNSLASQVSTASESLAVQPRSVASTPSDAAPHTFWSATPVVVGLSDIEDLMVNVRTGIRIRGRVQARTGTPPAVTSLNQQPIRFVFADGRQTLSLPGKVDSAGRFETPELPPGSYLLQYNPPSPWRVDSALLSGRDISEEPFELGQSPVSEVVITLTDQAPSLRGTVRDASGPRAGIAVLCFPTERRLWATVLSRRVRQVRTSASGDYSLSALPTGEYFVVALETDPGDSWQDPGLLERFSTGAVKVRLTSGIVTQSLEPMRRLPLPASNSLDVSHEAVFFGSVTSSVSGPRAEEPDEQGSQQPATGQLHGHVLNIDGRPVRAAVVSVVNSRSNEALSTMTDDEGQFAFVIPVPGYYKVRASKVGFIETELGSRDPGRPGHSIEVLAGIRKDVEIRLAKGAVVQGTVTAPDGDPVAGASVRVLTMDSTGILAAAKGATPVEAIADANGHFRVYGLLPGTIYVGATPGNTSAGTPARQASRGEIAQLLRGELPSSTATNRDADIPLSFTSAWFPGAPQFDGAQAIRIAASEERTIDIRLGRGPTWALRGVVQTSSGAAPSVASARVTVIPAGPYVPSSFSVSGALGSGESSSRGGATEVFPDAEGKFSIRGLTPGPYILVARGNAQNASGEIEWARVRIDVRPGDAPIQIRLQRPLTVAGRVRSLDLAVDPPALTLRLESAESLPGAVSPSAAMTGIGGNFSFANVLPGNYRLQLSGPPGHWQITEAKLGSIDILDKEVSIQSDIAFDSLAITVSAVGAELTGRFLDTTGMPALDYYIILFAATETYWFRGSRRVAVVRPGIDGTFTFGNLVAGKYKLAALADVQEGEWHNPSFLRELAATSIEVEIQVGSRVVQNIRIGRVPDE